MLRGVQWIKDGTLCTKYPHLSAGNPQMTSIAFPTSTVRQKPTIQTTSDDITMTSHPSTNLQRTSVSVNPDLTTVTSNFPTFSITCAVAAWNSSTAFSEVSTTFTSPRVGASGCSFKVVYTWGCGDGDRGDSDLLSAFTTQNLWLKCKALDAICHTQKAQVAYVRIHGAGFYHTQARYRRGLPGRRHLSVRLKPNPRHRAFPDTVST